MTAFSFIATPNKIKRGEAVTLRWNVDGVNAVTLNGEPVLKRESRILAPTATTVYTLRLTFGEGTKLDLSATVTVEEAVHAAFDANTPMPTVTLTPENIEQLKTYPRPPFDNGRGLHFHLDLRDESIAKSVERLKYINATWTLIYAQDELQAQRAAKACWAAGIMPVVRIGKKITEFFDPVLYVRALQAIGVPPYIQIYNEPGDGREWEPKRPKEYVQEFATKWVRHAEAVFKAGGYPGFQVMGKEELDGVINAVVNSGRDHIWERAFFVHHNYAEDHPPAFPYDEVNQQTKPGQTILDDRVAVLAPLAFARWMQDRLGFVLPMIGGEGGWQYGADKDPRYPKVQQPLHAQYHAEMFEWFRTGVLSNGEPLPDYLFSVTPWILGGWGTGEDWWGGPLGTNTETIEATRAIPPFVRHFSWEGEQPPVIEPPPPQPMIVEPPPEPPPPPLPQVDWDQRLDLLGIRLTRVEPLVGWRLIAAKYLDPVEADGKHHVYFKALNADGSPRAGIRFIVDWVGRRADENPGITVTNKSGEGNFPIFINMHPELKDGPVFATSLDQLGDRVDGMGLPNNHHVSFVLTYQLTV